MKILQKYDNGGVDFYSKEGQEGAKSEHQKLKDRANKANVDLKGISSFSKMRKKIREAEGYKKGGVIKEIPEAKKKKTKYFKRGSQKGKIKKIKLKDPKTLTVDSDVDEGVKRTTVPADEGWRTKYKYHRKTGKLKKRKHTWGNMWLSEKFDKEGKLKLKPWQRKLLTKGKKGMLVRKKRNPDPSKKKNFKKIAGDALIRAVIFHPAMFPTTMSAVLVNQALKKLKKRKYKRQVPR